MNTSNSKNKEDARRINAANTPPNTQLKQYFALVQKERQITAAYTPNAIQLTYPQLPTNYTWTKENGTSI
jgi:hypothetical protein